MRNYVEEQSEETLEIVEASLLWNKEPFLSTSGVMLGCPLSSWDRPRQMLKKKKKKEKIMKKKTVPVIPIIKPCIRKTTKPNRKGTRIDVRPEKERRNQCQRSMWCLEGREVPL